MDFNKILIDLFEKVIIEMLGRILDILISEYIKKFINMQYKTMQSLKRGSFFYSPKQTNRGGESVWLN